MTSGSNSTIILSTVEKCVNRKELNASESLHTPMLNESLTVAMMLGVNLASFLLLRGYSWSSRVFVPALRADRFQTMMSYIFWWQCTSSLAVLYSKTRGIDNLYFLVFLLNKWLGWTVSVASAFYLASSKRTYKDEKLTSEILTLGEHLRQCNRTTWLTITVTTVYSIVLSLVNFLGADPQEVAFYTQFGLILDFISFLSSLRLVMTTCDVLGVACLVIFGGQMISILGSLGPCMAGMDVTWSNFSHLSSVQSIASTVALYLLVNLKEGIQVGDISFQLYRVKTFLHSFKTIYTLPPEKTETFLNSYTNFDHDWADEAELVRKMGRDYYKEIQKKLVDYYSVLNHLCALGEVEKMYIPPAIDLSQGIIANQKLYERMMCDDLGIKKGNKVLDIGCGRGRVVCHVAQYTGAEMVGMNLDPDQLASAKRFAQGNGFSNQTRFLQGDMNALPLPFEDNSFDSVYHIQAFSYSKDLGKMFKDIHRILKPGGTVASLDWVTLDKYDPQNPEHVTLIKRIKPLLGAIGTPSVHDYVKAIEDAGFEVLINRNASVGGYQYPLIDRADKFFTKVLVLIKLAVKFRILPKHFLALFNRLTAEGQTFVETDKMGLATTVWYLVARKKK